VGGLILEFQRQRVGTSPFTTMGLPEDSLGFVFLATVKCLGVSEAFKSSDWSVTPSCYFRSMTLRGVSSLSGG
jgi:hypothetical protein